MAVDKSGGNIKKETWKRLDRESNPGLPGDKQERCPLCYAAPLSPAIFATALACEGIPVGEVHNPLLNLVHGKADS